MAPNLWLRYRVSCRLARIPRFPHAPFPSDHPAVPGLHATGRGARARQRTAVAEHGQFSDGETRYQILENVRGADVFVVQPCSHPVDFNLMQLLLMIDAFKRASAWRITPVIPYYPYARQDRKDRPRVAISAPEGDQLRRGALHSQGLRP